MRKKPVKVAKKEKERASEIRKKQTERQIDRWTDRQTNRQIDRQDRWMHVQNGGLTPRSGPVTRARLIRPRCICKTGASHPDRAPGLAAG